MQLNTLIRLGSLAFNVAQDEKVQELVKMARSGAKRRGLFAPTGNRPPGPIFPRGPLPR